TPSPGPAAHSAAGAAPDHAVTSGHTTSSRAARLALIISSAGISQRMPGFLAPPVPPQPTADKSLPRQPATDKSRRQQGYGQRSAFLPVLPRIQGGLPRRAGVGPLSRPCLGVAGTARWRRCP